MYAIFHFLICPPRKCGCVCVCVCVVLEGGKVGGWLEKLDSWLHFN